VIPGAVGLLPRGREIVPHATGLLTATVASGPRAHELSHNLDMQAIPAAT
jgi:hypothetical protein